MSDSEVGGGGPRVRPPQELLKARLNSMIEAFGSVHAGATYGQNLDAAASREHAQLLIECRAQLADLRGDRDRLHCERDEWQARSLREINAMLRALAERDEARSERDALQQFPCPDCGEPIIAPHVRCQRCICKQRDTAEAEVARLRAERDTVQQQLDQEKASNEGSGWRRVRLTAWEDRALKADADLAALRSRGQALVQLIQEEIVTEDGGPTANYCWWCHQDVNGKDGPPEPHAQNCWLLRAKAACADALTAALKESK